MREELLGQLATEWEEGAPQARQHKLSATGSTTLCVGDEGLPGPAVRGYSKVSWMSHRLEELGEPAMTDDERRQWCGSVTVSGSGS